LALNSITLDDLEHQNSGFYGFFFTISGCASLYHSKKAPPSPTPHAPMADVYYGPDGPSPSGMRFSKL